MTQYIIFTGLIYKGIESEKEINEFFKKERWGKVKYKNQFKTIAGQGGEGGRNDVLFKLITKKDEIGKFSVGRFRIGGISWLGDYVNNNKKIIPYKELEKLRKLVIKTGDYAELEEEDKEDLK